MIFAALPILCCCCKDGEINGNISYIDYYDDCTYPAAGAKVQKIEILSGNLRKAVSSTHATDEGNYSFEHVKEGKWIIKAVMNKEDIIYVGNSEEFELCKKDIKQINFTLKKSQSIYE